MMKAELIRFVRESNQIEGILRHPTSEEVDATDRFIRLNAPVVSDIEDLVEVYQPEAKLRLSPGMNVRVGRHIAPPGGPEIGARLAALLENLGMSDPWETHVGYETLHPFTDGNGRSGRALWAWQMCARHDHGLELGFLHRFYYQTLAAVGRA